MTELVSRADRQPFIEVQETPLELDRNNNSVNVLHHRYLNGEELAPGPLTKILHLLSEEDYAKEIKRIQKAQAAFWEQWTPFRCGLVDEGQPTFDSVVNLLPVREDFAHSIDLKRGDLVVDLMGGSANMAQYFLGEERDIAGYVTIDSNPLIADRARKQLKILGVSSFGVIEHDLSKGLPEDLGGFVEKCRPEQVRFVSNWGITYLDGRAMIRLVADCFDNEFNNGIPTTLNFNMLTDGKFDPKILRGHFVREIVPERLATLKWSEVMALFNAGIAIPQIVEFGKRMPEVAPIWYPEEIQHLLEAEGFRVDNIDESLLWEQSTAMEIVPMQVPTMLY